MSADDAADGECETNRSEPRQARYDQLREEARRHGLFDSLGFELTVQEPGRVSVTMPFDESVSNLGSGTLHGGLTATLIDTASGFALRSTFEDDSVSLTTTDLNVRYVRPARDDVRCVARVVRAGGSMGVTEATVTTTHEGEEVVVATGGTSYRLFRGER